MGEARRRAEVARLQGKPLDFRKFRRGARVPPPEPVPGVIPDAGPPPVFEPTPTNRCKVFFACPSVDGKVNWSIAHQMGKMMSYNADPQSPLSFATFIMVGQRPIEYARNKIVQTFMNQSDCHWLYMVDADQVMPENFWELMRVPTDIVSGLTYCWVGNNYLPGRLRVNQYGLDEKSQCFNLTPPEGANGPYQIPVVGTGCIAIRRRVFEAIGQKPFKFTYTDEGKVIAGEDVNFSVSAQRAGFRIAVHPGVKFGHMKELDLAQIEDYERASHEFRKAGKTHQMSDMLSIAV